MFWKKVDLGIDDDAGPGTGQDGSRRDWGSESVVYMVAQVAALCAAPNSRLDHGLWITACGSGSDIWADPNVAPAWAYLFAVEGVDFNVGQ